MVCPTLADCLISCSWLNFLWFLSLIIGFNSYWPVMSVWCYISFIENKQAYMNYSQVSGKNKCKIYHRDSSEEGKTLTFQGNG